MTNMTTLLVFTTLPDATQAHAIAQTLIAEGLAACVSAQAACTSVYRWQGKVEQATEVPLFIKTTAEQYGQLQQRLTELHPYEVPEIIAVPVTQGLPVYLDWVKASCTS